MAEPIDGTDIGMSTSADSPERPKTAYVTGGASGIGRALTQMLVGASYRVFIADLDIHSASQLADMLNASYPFADPRVHCAKVDVASWESQLDGFKQALAFFNGRLDVAAPVAGIAERQWLKEEGEMLALGLEDEFGEGFMRPDLRTLEVDLQGVLWTVGLAVQQMRRQEMDGEGFRGRIACVSSTCGLYSIPALPVYTAAKQGVVGFVRSYGKLLPGKYEILMNAVCPNIVRTNIEGEEYYAAAERKGLIVPMQNVLDCFDHVLSSKVSGEVFEVGPDGEGGSEEKWVVREGLEYLDKKTERSVTLLEEEKVRRVEVTDEVDEVRNEVEKLERAEMKGLDGEAAQLIAGEQVEDRFVQDAVEDGRKRRRVA
ncbi:NAD(P)-binding protein [Polyplosphaeria fusca]|uniref:NAD(P)-binding protein n=1 Tax=Polyplosphaeria fusca TaxID=682080 RepID=A0A9P4QPW5_9PLEO|nr:NAD(P)-binding protein [Polyplosphaeria fusca]